MTDEQTSADNPPSTKFGKPPLPVGNRSGHIRPKLSSPGPPPREDCNHLVLLGLLILPASPVPILQIDNRWCASPYAALNRAGSPQPNRSGSREPVRCIWFLWCIPFYETFFYLFLFSSSLFPCLTPHR